MFKINDKTFYLFDCNEYLTMILHGIYRKNLQNVMLLCFCCKKDSFFRRILIISVVFTSKMAKSGIIVTCGYRKL